MSGTTPSAAGLRASDRATSRCRPHGKWKEYAGGYTDWLRQRPAVVEEKPAAKAPAREKTRSKLSYKESRELESLPGEIEALEAEQKALEEKMSAGDYYKLGADEVKRDRRRAEEIEGELMGKLARWEELEGKASLVGSGPGQ
jgi:ABC transport system ATP-binding/permease protein